YRGRAGAGRAEQLSRSVGKRRDQRARRHRAHVPSGREPVPIDRVAQTGDVERALAGAQHRLERVAKLGWVQGDDYLPVVERIEVEEGPVGDRSGRLLLD